MKKFLLSLAAVAMAASMSATSYTVFDIANPTTWTGDGNGWQTEVSAGGKTFKLTTSKAESTTDLISPVANTFAWRVYKGSTFTIECADVNMKQVVITYDDYEDGKYIKELVLPTGYTGTLDGAEYTIVGAGANTLTMQASLQVRIKTLIVSDEAGSVEPPVVQDGIIYSNNFETSIDEWTKLNDESLSDFAGWKINNSATAPKCAICNSYYSGENHAADSWFYKAFDFSEYSDVTMTVEQAFGYDFPTSQVENYTVNIRKVGETNWTALVFSSFPEVPASGNWSKTFAPNTFDLAEYDGEKVEIGFRYLSDGSKSRAWELKNFKLEGNKKGAVEGVTIDNNVASVYYNMQGVQVENPSKGLYIVVKDNKSTKVIL